MESKIRQLVWGLGAVALLAIAFLIASAISGLISQKVIEITPYAFQKVELEEKKTAANAITPDDYDMLIYNRNLFNQKAGEDEEYVEPEPEIVEEDEESEESVSAETEKLPVLTDLRALLIGTNVSKPAQYSVAIFRPLDNTDELSVYLHEGDDLLGEARILKIVRNRVYMVRHTKGNRLEYLDIETTEDDLKQVQNDNEAKKPAEKPKTDKKDKEKEEDTKEKKADKPVVDASVIKRVNADTYAIPKDTVAEIRKNPNILKDPKFGALPGIQPVYGGGGIKGYRLTNVDTNSIYSQLGIKSGDILLNVNGQTMDNPQKAMSLFDQLKPGQDVKLTVNRFGKEKTITYQLDE